MSKISCIDDLLTASANPAPSEPKEVPKAPVEKAAPVEKPENVEVEYESDDADEAAPALNEESDDNDEDAEADKGEEKAVSENEADVDEYGNPKEVIPKGLKDRLDRKEKKHQEEMAKRDYQIQQLQQQLSTNGASKEVQQAVKDFEHDPNSEIGWEQQLTDFVEKAFTNMQTKQQNQKRQEQEQQAERQFVEKFTKGMQRFGDFAEVVGTLPLDDAMTLALRGMADPTAFIYAAGKRQATEIERIAKLSDPYARMVEMGKLEERMRKNKVATKAPRPLAKMKEDSHPRVTPKPKEANGDDLLARADANRIASVKNRQGARR